MLRHVIPGIVYRYLAFVHLTVDVPSVYYGPVIFARV